MTLARHETDFPVETQARENGSQYGYTKDKIIPAQSSRQALSWGQSAPQLRNSAEVQTDRFLNNTKYLKVPNYNFNSTKWSLKRGLHIYIWFGKNQFSGEF